MNSEFEVVQTKAVLLAYLENIVEQAQVSVIIPSMLAELNAWADQKLPNRTSVSFAVYDFLSGQMRLRIGLPVDNVFVSGNRIRCMKLRSYRAVHTVHLGSYEGLYDVQRRIREWCRTHSIDTGHRFWEVYGPWRDTPDYLRTDVFVQVK